MRTTSYLMLAAVLAAVATANLHSIDFRANPEDKTLAVKSGDLIRITLAENPTTGFSWKYENPFEKTTGVYTVQMDDFAQEAEADGMVGGKGIRTIVIKAEKAGTENFEVIYVRSWEYKDFVETKRSSNSAPVAMKDIPNSGYRKIAITVSE